MALHAPILAMRFADATAQVRRMRGEAPASSQERTGRGLQALGHAVRHALHEFAALQGERQALATQAAGATGLAPQAQARLAAFDAEWWRTGWRAAQMADALLSLQAEHRAAAAPALCAEVQVLAIAVGCQPDASVLRATAQRLVAQPASLIGSPGVAGSTERPDALFAMLAMAAVLLEREATAP